MKILFVSLLVAILIALPAAGAEQPHPPTITITHAAAVLYKRSPDTFLPWMRYSLMRGSLAYTQGNHSFDTEVMARNTLIAAWQEAKIKNVNAKDAYLDALLSVQQAGFLREYVWLYLRDSAWAEPPLLKSTEFQRWASAHLSGHLAETYMIAEFR